MIFRLRTSKQTISQKNQINLLARTPWTRSLFLSTKKMLLAQAGFIGTGPFQMGAIGPKNLVAANSCSRVFTTKMGGEASQSGQNHFQRGSSGKQRGFFGRVSDMEGWGNQWDLRILTREPIFERVVVGKTPSRSVPNTHPSTYVPWRPWKVRKGPVRSSWSTATRRQRSCGNSLTWSSVSASMDPRCPLSDFSAFFGHLSNNTIFWIWFIHSVFKWKIWV